MKKKESNGFAVVLSAIIILAVIAGFYQSSLKYKTKKEPKKEIIQKDNNSNLNDNSLTLEELRWMIQGMEDYQREYPNNENINSQLKYWKALEKEWSNPKPKEPQINIHIKIEQEEW